MPDPSTSLSDEGRAIVEHLGGHWNGHAGMCRCPAHEDRTPSLSVRVGHTWLIYKCFHGCTREDVMRALRQLNLEPQYRVCENTSAATESEGERNYRMSALARSLWTAARALRSSMAAKYLDRRGLLDVTSDALRFSPRTQIDTGHNASHHPALLAAVRDQTGVVAVHRTLLDPATNGKVAFAFPKRALGPLGTGAVRLSADGPTLGIAEGIETALSAEKLLGIPVWAVLGNERFPLVHIPTTVSRLVILADNDKAGHVAAFKARDAHAQPGREIVDLWPPHGLNDWNDAIRSTDAHPQMK